MIRAKGLVDGLFLAKGLGDGDAGDRFLDVGIDLGQDAPGLLGRLARQASKAQRGDDHNGRDRGRDQRQLHVDGEEDDKDDEHQQNLAHEVERQRDDGGEVLGVRGDAAETILPVENSS